MHLSELIPLPSGARTTTPSAPLENSRSLYGAVWMFLDNRRVAKWIGAENCVLIDSIKPKIDENDQIDPVVNQEEDDEDPIDLIEPEGDGTEEVVKDEDDKTLENQSEDSSSTDPIDLIELENDGPDEVVDGDEDKTNVKK
eukprot:345183_1